MSKKTITALIVVALLVGIGVFNYAIKMDPTQLAARGVGQDAHSHSDDDGDDHEHDQAPTIEDMLEPLGPEGAAVTIEVLWQDPQDLEGTLRPMLTSVASHYAGHVRVEFFDPATDEYAQTVQDVAAGVPVGLLINGEMIKQVPEAPLGMLAFAGTPTFEEWSMHDLLLVVEHELEAKGIAFEPQVEHDHSHDHPAHDHAGHSH
ncbi:MAG: hypothetical protein ACOX9R_06845 [Armatimonadota bacterium]|jgi:ABC-type nickel/cobalt efflux system permease component RcnA